MAGQTFLTYSFLDVNVTLAGPFGVVSLGAGAGAADEGIDVGFAEEKDTMHIGADGSVAHNLHASKAGKITIRLLKTSPTNQQLSTMYNQQSSSSLFWGQNILVITHVVTGDVYSCQAVAFVKFPDNKYGKEQSTMEWEFNAGRIEPTLGGAGLLFK